MTPHCDRQRSAIKHMCQFDLKTTVWEIEAERIVWLIHKYLKWFDKVYGHISKRQTLQQKPPLFQQGARTAVSVPT